ncbi:uncharacterized protein BO88DRAFT_417045 [Aspergillus vadensis CBS 113365]|uniref:Uncharacterized protein n=1 Tax=Aspergillus vadensis (strain CBS 113365 / IMI 142717 / IBT 24658) TaxID=1448311 RepID=A0A319B9M1_ASPVC|nr:hypothetical protein BO88DRAFT_417045 [Aspergillus vadensis CBS 113365]PYH67150.1 hypothetical protein BO88DRAFT_417045 [Aspergillus vadensis CBS 113365]
MAYLLYTLQTLLLVGKGWELLLSVIIFLNLYMPADNSTGDPMADTCPSFNLPESIASSVAAGLSSIPETGPPSFPDFSCIDQAEDVSWSLPTNIPVQLPSWDSLAPVSTALSMTDFHRYSMHQESPAPVPVRNIESLVPPWLQIMMNYHGTAASPLDNVSANSQESSCNVTVPEDQVEHRHST